MSHYWDILETRRKLKEVLIYDPARKEIVSWPFEIKKDLGSILTKLQKGDSVGYPDVDSMRSVAPACFEVRLKGSDGIYRIFCVIKTEFGILVFHSFKKKTQKTPLKEIETGRKRLAAFLKELESEEN
jgi:phage-related protein